MSLRTDLFELLSDQTRSVSSLALELRLPKPEIEDHLRHVIRTARAGGHRVSIEPARCRSCGFTFAEDRLTKPGKCPSCRGARLVEAMIHIDRRPA
jgi:transcriptional regulator